MIADISGYDASVIDAEYFQQLEALSGDRIREKISRLDDLVGKIEAGEIFPVISIGSNCGPAAKLRAVGANTTGSNFFDNIVIEPEDVARLIRSEFSNILCLKNLTIGEWELHDSVYDVSHKAYYHHYFHLSAQKWKTVNGAQRRIVDTTDIPLLLPIVRAQFEYLAEKFLRVARANGRKLYIVRKSFGEPLSAAELDAMYNAIASIGGRQFEIIAIYSYGEPESQAALSHRYITEGAERWGQDNDWRNATFEVSARTGMAAQNIIVASAAARR